MSFRGHPLVHLFNGQTPGTCGTACISRVVWVGHLCTLYTVYLARLGPKLVGSVPVRVCSFCVRYSSNAPIVL